MNPRDIPSIERLRQRDLIQALLQRYGHDAVVQALREETDALRERLRGASNVGANFPPTHEASAGRRSLAGAPNASDALGWLGEGGSSHRDATEASTGSDLDPVGAIETAVARRLHRLFQSSLRPAINATGVIIHTNLGRAPLVAAALDEVSAIGSGYSTLEYDVTAGARGSRDLHAETWLTRLTGAEAAAVVNNNAAATLLILSSLAAGREVLISRGELVEIGGGFRVPDVMAQSGAILREVGTTNRTRLADYGAAIGERTALILRVHRSNFRIEGFTEQPALAELVELGHRFSVPVVDDLGSGYLDASVLDSKSDATGVSHVASLLRDEPTVRLSVTAGVDVICFSGDKLLGGPQAGVIVGTRALIERVRRHPLMRALRVDKMTYAALVATLREYVAGRAAETVPVLRMIRLAPLAVEKRARALADALRSSTVLRTEVTPGMSTIGGGSAPGQLIPTMLLALSINGLSPDALDARLRGLDPPVIARIENDRVVLDLRTVLAEQDAALARALLTL